MSQSVCDTETGLSAEARQLRRLPELLAPAGNWECAKAAVENGADAIYFGLDRFNARIRAANFAEADLPRLMEFLHRRGVRGYVSFNTLVFEDEMAEAEQALRAVIAAGVDGALVQDVGVCRLIRELSPDFPIHASTQMSITSAAGVAFARELGCQRVVLARECSLREVEQIRAELMQTPGPTGTPSLGESPPATPELEVFVHGALCVAYSGQCLTSEALGGRSANRGECAQACRMPYELLADGQPVPLEGRRYLLSPQDLAGLELLPELLRAGVAAIKIEGRLKTPEYVANITRIYRQALDRWNAASEPVLASTSGNRRTPEGVSPEERYEMEMAFSRGLYTGWLRGVNHPALVHGRFGTKRGVYLGQVQRVRGDRVVVRLEGPLKPGDGVVFDAGHPEVKEEGGRVYAVQTTKLNAQGGVEAALAFGRGAIDFSRIRPGDKVWKTSDPELERRLRQSYAGDTPRFQRPVDMEVQGRAGQPLILTLRDQHGRAVQVASQVALAPAATQPLTTERLRAQLGRLGSTPFRLGRLVNRLEGEVILPVSELNRLRREVAAQMQALWASPRRWTLIPAARRGPSVGWSEDASGFSLEGIQDARAAELIVLVRSLPQLEAALDAGVATVYCDFEDPKRYREAVARVRARPGLTGRPRPEVWVAPPRIFKPGETWVLQQVRSCGADGYLARNYDHLRWFAGERRRGDFALNVANARAAAYFKHRFGLERLTASYDLNATQLEALLRATPPAWWEVTLHQHMPMFHMEHCLFCACLSQGTNYTNCGRPCDRHQLKLRDRAGVAHPVLADAGCRNTVFNGRAQTGAAYAARLVALGLRHFRVEFVDETPAQVAQVIRAYDRLLRGEMTGEQLWRELKLQHQLGVTRGPLDKP